MLTDLESKQKYWKNKLQQHVTGPDDPNYVVIKFAPSVIEYREPGLEEPLVYTI